MAFTSQDPATGKRLKTYSEMTRLQVEHALARADKTFSSWRESSLKHRATILKSVAKYLRRHEERFAAMITAEMGKPIAQAHAEIEKCAVCCEFYAKKGAGFLAPYHPAGATGYVSYQPLGILLAIMPWNFPFWQAFRAAAPALMAGNVVVLKHATNVCGCALAIEEAFLKGRAPTGAFTTLLIRSKRIKQVLADPRVKAVTLTGSTAAGKSVAAQAGALLKKGVFELGGSDPYIILEDADLEKAAEICAQGRLINSGQSCVSAKRFIVVERVREEFERRFLERLSSRRIGPPRNRETDVGPLARLDLRAELHAQVTKSVRAGASLLRGGKIPPGPGCFYPITVLTNVKKGMAAYDEEFFGPVASIIPVKDEAEAIRVANDTVYGLGAAVFTRNKKRGETIARDQIEAGLTFVNDFVKSDPALPFGGTKQSGYGRELGFHGIHEFVNTKTVVVR